MNRYFLAIGLSFLLAIFVSQGVCVELQDAVGVWLLDETSGEIAKDSSGNGNDGTLHGGEWVDGQVGNCLKLSGSNEFVEVPDSDSLDLVEEVSMVCWFNWEGAGDGWQTFFSKGPMSGTNENYAHFVNTGGGYTHFILNAGGARSNVDSPGSSFEPNEWYHAAATYDGETRRIYINGEEVKSQATSGDLVPNDNYLGLGFRQGSSHYWMGMLDDMAVFKRGLSDDEINDIMDNGLAEVMLSVDPKDKIALTWGKIKVK